MERVQAVSTACTQQPKWLQLETDNREKPTLPLLCGPNLTLANQIIDKRRFLFIENAN